MNKHDSPIPELSEVCSYLQALLEVTSYQDMAINGLQIESPVSTVSKVGFAVDSGLSVMQRAAALGCNLLVVHHGLLWGKCEPFTGPLARKLQLCMVSGLSLYAAHLPLDGHLEVGNAAQIAKGLGLTRVEGFLNYGPRTIGVQGELTTELSLEALSERVSVLCKNPNPLLLPFGKRSIRTVAIVTGSGSSAIPNVADAGIDLLISGEPKQEAYHRAKELGCSVLFAGHYATETFGVRALERVLAERFRVETEWIDEPTGI